MAGPTITQHNNSAGVQTNNTVPHQPDSTLPEVARALDQRLEQMLYSGEWGPAITATVVKAISSSTASHRRTQQEVQQQEDSQGQGTGRRRRRGSSSSVDEEVVQRLVTVLGQDAAEKVVAAIDKFARDMNGKTAVNPDQIAQLTKDLAQALGGDGAMQVLGLSPEQVENIAQNGELSLGQVLTLVSSVVKEADEMGVAAEAEKVIDAQDILDAIQQATASEISRAEAITLLSTEAGITTLQSRLTSISDAEARVAAIEALQRFLGQNDLATFAARYYQVTGEPLSFTIQRPPPHLEGIAFAQVHDRRLSAALPAADIALYRTVRSVNEYATHLAVLNQERSRLEQQLPIQRVEQHAASQALAEVLERTLSPGEAYSDAAILSDLQRLYPGFTARNLAEMYTKLEAAHTTPDDELDEIMQQYRVVGVGELYYIQRESKIQFKDQLTRILPALRNLRDISATVTTTETRLTSGLFEESKNLQSQLLSATRLDTQRLQQDYFVAERIVAAETRLKALQSRIEAAHSASEVANEIALRDQAEWEVVQKRIEQMLQAPEPNLPAILGTLDQYSNAYPPGSTSRSLEYQELAFRLRNRFTTAEQVYSITEKTTALLRSKADELQSEIDGARGDLELQRAVARDWTFYRGDDNITAERSVISLTSETIPQLESALAVSRSLEEATRRSGGTNLQHTRTALLRQAFTGGPLASVLPPLNERALPTISQNERTRTPYHQMVVDARQRLIETRRNAEEDYAASALTPPPQLSRSAFLVTSAPLGAQAPLARTTQTLIRDTIFDLREDRSLTPPPEALAALRELASTNPRLHGILQGIPTSLPIKEQTTKLFTALGMHGAASQDDLMRVQLFLSTYGNAESLSGLGGITQVTNEREAWAALEQVQGPALNGLARTCIPLAALSRIEQRLASLSHEERYNFHRQFEATTGMTFGRSLVQMRNAVDDHSLLLIKIAGMSDVTNQDLVEFFPAGFELTENPAYRQQRLVLLVRQDAEQKVELFTKLDAEAAARAEEHTVLSLAELTATGEFDAATLSDIHARREQVLREDLQVVTAVFGERDSSFLARTRAASHFREAQNAHIQLLYSSVHHRFEESASRVVQGFEETARRIADKEKETDPDQVSIRKEPDLLATITALRNESFTESETLLVRSLYGQMVRHNRTDRTVSAGALLAQDLNSTLAQARLVSPSHPVSVNDLVRGGEAALRRFDVSLLDAALATNNGDASVVALRGLSGGAENSDGVKARISEINASVLPRFDTFLQTTVGRESKTYLTAVDNRDRVTLAAIDLRHSGLMGRGNTPETVDAFFALRSEFTADELARLKTVWKEVYSKELGHEFGDAFSHVRHVWDSILSKKPEEDLWAAYHLTKHALSYSNERGHEQLFRNIESLGIDREKLLEKCNLHVGGRDYLDFLRGTSGELGVERATLARCFFKGMPLEAVVDTSRQFNAAESDFRMLSGMYSERRSIHAETGRNFQNLCSDVVKADREYQARYVGRGTALDILNAHKRFKERQETLLTQQNRGVASLEGTLSAQRANIRVFARDIEEHGRSTIALEASSRDLTHRALLFDQTIEWVSMRRQDYNAWRAEMGAKEIHLKWIDQRVTLGVAAAKVVVVVGVSMVASPAAGLAVSLAWNVADKGVRLAMGTVDAGTAVRELAFEATLDIVLFGGLSVAAKALPALTTRVGFVKVAVQSSDDVAKTQRVWGSLYRTAAPRVGIGHARDVIPKTLDEIASSLNVSRSVATKFVSQVENVVLNPANYTQHFQYAIKKGLTTGAFDIALGTSAATNGLTRAANTPTPPQPQIVPPTGVSPVTPVTQLPPQPVVPATQTVPNQPQHPTPQPAQSVTVEPPAALPTPVATTPTQPSPQAEPINVGAANTPAAPPTVEPPAAVNATTPVTPPNVEPPAASTNANTQAAPQNVEPPAANILTPAPQPATPPTPPNVEPPIPAPEPTPQAPSQIVFDWSALDNSINKTFDDTIRRLIDAICTSTPYIPPITPPPARPPQPPAYVYKSTSSFPSPGDDSFAPPPRSRTSLVFEDPWKSNGNSYTNSVARVAQEADVKHSQQNGNSNANGVAAANAQTEALKLFDQMSNTERVSQQLAATQAQTQAERTAEANKAAAAHTVSSERNRELDLQKVALREADAILHQTVKDEQRVAEAKKSDTTSELRSREADRIAVENAHVQARNVQTERETLTAFRNKDIQTRIAAKQAEQSLGTSPPHYSTSEQSSILLTPHSSRVATQTQTQAKANTTANAVEANEPFRNTQQQEFAARAIALEAAGTQANSSSHVTPAIQTQQSLTELHTPTSRATNNVDFNKERTESLRQIYAQIEAHRVESHEVAQEEEAILSAVTESVQDRTAARAKARKSRLKKQAKADEQLRDYIMHELKAKQFLAAERDKLLALLRRLGITEEEYRTLVAQLGEIEAQRQAQGIRGFQNPLMLEEEEDTPTTDSSLAEQITTEDIPKKEAGIVLNSSEVTATTKVSRAELFATLSSTGKS